MRCAYKVKTLFAGTDQPPEDGRILLVEDGMVAGICSWSEEAELQEHGWLVQDYSTCFAMPGMIDSHVHMVLPGDGTAAEDFLFQHTKGEILLTAARNAFTAIKAGITTLRDCGGLPDIMFELRRNIQSGIIQGPDLILCGSSLTTTAGHTWFFGGECDTEQETVRKIRQLHKQGADFVKLIATGGGTKGVIQHAQMLSDGQLRTASEEAHRLGKMTTAHVCSTDTARTAVENGVDMLEHLIWADELHHLEMDERLAGQIAQMNIPVCATMSVIPVSIARYEALDRPLTQTEQLDYDIMCRFRDTIFEGFRLTCRDIRYIPGTDAGWRGSTFGSLAECMIPMSSLGMSNLEVLHSATGLAAEILGVADRLGVLVAGKQADIVLLSASPLESMENLHRIKAVFKKGACVISNQ